MEFEEKTIARQTIYEGAIFDVVVDDVELPNGLGQAKRELVLHRGAVSILAVTPENNILIVKQYRKAIEAVSYEIPAGKLEIGEEGSELEAASRELEEETGYKGQLEQISEFYTAIGFSNEKIRLYLARDLQKVENPRPQDDDEVLEVYELSYQDCLDLIAMGQIVDAKTIIAINYFGLYLGGS
ncbi:NUDIX domain-containing protein [Streptococcus porcinus]|uniref:ADP-ribose pyrophosphatase n=2 Tax=Streptococcus porcinus TaxID=1340 RepID=A0A4V0HAQ7_STRPO|nr:NUDIX hydrolase [Streptococcus porcinus]EGJ27946.1 hydrolase, NUDIX family [Streptococcus porcinus str. Jelinkova 176]SQG44826.1 ADP-ribose pyrophosphatase [Streptococcus porcinus]VTT45228.1 ADP-ribose pyrophosphatase [Streptococcus porcinus]VTT46742.1 ADP-ribose pyrophosphatase [Streptococcus porcinus]